MAQPGFGYSSPMRAQLPRQASSPAMARCVHYDYRGDYSKGLREGQGRHEDYSRGISPACREDYSRGLSERQGYREDYSKGLSEPRPNVASQPLQQSMSFDRRGLLVPGSPPKMPLDLPRHEVPITVARSSSMPQTPRVRQPAQDIPVGMGDVLLNSARRSQGDVLLNSARRSPREHHQGFVDPNAAKMPYDPYTPALTARSTIGTATPRDCSVPRYVAPSPGPPRPFNPFTGSPPNGAALVPGRTLSNSASGYNLRSPRVQPPALQMPLTRGMLDPNLLSARRPPMIPRSMSYGSTASVAPVAMSTPRPPPPPAPFPSTGSFGYGAAPPPLAPMQTARQGRDSGVVQTYFFCRTDPNQKWGFSWEQHCFHNYAVRMLEEVQPGSVAMAWNETQTSLERCIMPGDVLVSANGRITCDEITEELLGNSVALEFCRGRVAAFPQSQMPPAALVQQPFFPPRPLPPMGFQPLLRMPCAPPVPAAADPGATNGHAPPPEDGQKANGQKQQRPMLVKVAELSRSSPKKQWGFSWRREGFHLRGERVVEEVQAGTPASDWNAKLKPEQCISPGDVLISANGRTTAEAIGAELRKNEVVLIFHKGND